MNDKNHKADLKKRPARRTIVGIIVALPGRNTAIVKTEETKQHPKYKKRYMRSKKYHADSGEKKLELGQKVTLVESRPGSSLKRWRIKV